MFKKKLSECVCIHNIIRIFLYKTITTRYQLNILKIVVILTKIAF